MANWLYLVVVILKIYNCFCQNLNKDSYNSSCEIDTCADCFNRLAFEAVYRDRNQKNLQRAFYPPNHAPPVFVIVTYNYSDPNGNMEENNTYWYWSGSTYYIYQPLAMLQFTSLFFADPEFRTEKLTIVLPTDCMNASLDDMQLLTQRLQLFAKSRTIYPSISSDYQPKAESETTLKLYFKNNRDPVKYLFATQFVLYFMSIGITPFVILYFLYGFPFKLKKYISDIRIEEGDENYWCCSSMVSKVQTNGTDGANATISDPSSTDRANATSSDPNNTDGANATSSDPSSTDRANATSSEPSSTDGANPTSSDPSSTDRANATSSEPSSTDGANPTSSYPSSTDGANATSSEPSSTDGANATSSEPSSTDQTNDKYGCICSDKTCSRCCFCCVICRNISDSEEEENYTWCCLWCKVSRTANEIKDIEKNNKIMPKDWEKQSLIMAVGILSWIFWLYAVAMSATGVHFQRKLEDELNDIHNEGEYLFQLLYGITMLILIENLSTPFIYGIIYGILITMISKERRKRCCSCDIYSCTFILEIAGVVSLSLPCTTLAVHFTHIVIGFIHNEYHATSVAFFYVVVITLNVIMFKIITHLYISTGETLYRFNNYCAFACFVVVYLPASIGLNLFVAFIAALYFLLPINNAIDDAPDRLNTIVSGVVLVFAGYMIFLLNKINKHKDKCKNKDSSNQKDDSGN